MRDVFQKIVDGTDEMCAQLATALIGDVRSQAGGKTLDTLIQQAKQLMCALLDGFPPRGFRDPGQTRLTRARSSLKGIDSAEDLERDAEVRCSVAHGMDYLGVITGPSGTILFCALAFAACSAVHS